MRVQSLLLASAIALGLAIPAGAQQSSTMQRYAVFFKYSDQAIKGMIDNPQDRTAANSRLIEAFGGKLESLYFFPMGGQFDGIVISQFPNAAGIEAIELVVRSTGSLLSYQAVPIMTGPEFQALMERAKQGAANYTAPGGR